MVESSHSYKEQKGVNIWHQFWCVNFLIPPSDSLTPDKCPNNSTQFWHCECVKVTQSCPTLCNPMDYTVHGILQARIPEWVAVPFSRGSFQPRDWTEVSRIAGCFFTSWATREDSDTIYLEIASDSLVKSQSYKTAKLPPLQMSITHADCRLCYRWEVLMTSSWIQLLIIC